MPNLVLSKKGADPRAINSMDSDVPIGARGAWKAAMKSVDASNPVEVATHLKAVVEAAPKFARGWQTLGIIYENLQMPADAKAAYTHAVEIDPKMVAAWGKRWPG